MGLISPVISCSCSPCQVAAQKIVFPVRRLDWMGMSRVWTGCSNRSLSVPCLGEAKK